MITMNIDSIKSSTMDAGIDSVFIYRLLEYGVVVYVGQTEDIKKRIGNHITTGKVFDHVMFYLCEKSKSTEIERDEIISFNPKLNKELPRTNKYITIKQAEVTVCKGISKGISKHLKVHFERKENKIRTPKYVLRSDALAQVEIITDFINKLYEKECK